MDQRQPPAHLSEDERKTVLLGLAHLAVYLPDWQDHLRAAAGKIHRDGAALFDEFKGLSTAGEPIEQIFELTR